MFATVNDSRHGAELTDINGKIGSAINRDSMSQFIKLISQAMGREIAEGQIQLDGIDLTAMQAAEMLVNSAHGIKVATSTEDFCTRLIQLIKMFEGATALD